jgi:hypothetical protein
MLRVLFDEAFDRLLRQDIENVSSDVSERNLCARLAPVLETLAHEAGLTEYYADAEYNRNQGRVKTILDERQQIVSVTCDVILHSRGHFPARDNLIAIEMKKATRPHHSKESDRVRLRALTMTPNAVYPADGRTLPEHVCGYELGIFVELDRLKGIARIEEYQGGELTRSSEIQVPGHPPPQDPLTNL